MTNPYSSVSISGYDSNPPSDDGSETSNNEISWSKHKTKLGDPLKDAINAINSNVTTAFGKILFNEINSQSSNYTVQESDQGKLISCTNSITVTLLPAGTAGSNFTLGIRNDGTGTVTVDGDGSETINGSTTIDLEAGETLVITSDGSNWEGAFCTNYKGILHMASASSIGSGVTRFLGIGGLSASEGDVSFTPPVSGTLKFLEIACTDPGGSETVTCTVRKGGSDTSITATVNGGSSSAQDRTNTVTVGTGDRMSLKVVTSASSANVTVRATIALIP